MHHKSLVPFGRHNFELKVHDLGQLHEEVDAVTLETQVWCILIKVLRIQGVRAVGDPGPGLSENNTCKIILGFARIPKQVAVVPNQSIASNGMESSRIEICRHTHEQSVTHTQKHTDCFFCQP